MNIKLELLVNWLTNSQYDKGKITGFIPKYTTRFRKLDVYPEITGYAISTFSSLYNITKENIYIDRAIWAAEGIIRYIKENGAIPSIIHKNTDFQDVCYSFDQGIITRGLLDLAESMKNNSIKGYEKYLEYGLKGIDFIINNSNNGRIPDQFYLNGNIKSDFTYCIMLKICRSYVKAYQFTNDEKYLNEIIKVSNYVIDNFQMESGVFKMDSQHERNRVHYHCYAIEALIETLEVYDNKKILNSAVKGTEYLASIQKENGGFSNRVIEDKDDGLEDIPPTAQAIAIWHYFNLRNKFDKYCKNIKKAEEYLDERQYKGGFKLIGGLPFMLPQSKRISCSWATIFYIDSILKLEGVS